MRYLILIGLVCSIASAGAQSSEASKKVRFGFSGSATATFLETKTTAAREVSNNGGGGGFRYGALVSWQISRRFFTSAQFGLFQMNVNSSVKTTLYNDFTYNSTNAQEHYWLELPVDFNVVINPASKIKAFAGVGASLMYRMSAPVNSSNNSTLLAQLGTDFPIRKSVLRLTLSAEKTLQAMVFVPPASPTPYTPSYTSANYEYRFTTLSLSVKYLF